eukprot:11298958-Alexandrium_andersonii.AAC.1
MGRATTHRAPGRPRAARPGLRPPQMSLPQVAQNEMESSAHEADGAEASDTESSRSAAQAALCWIAGQGNRGWRVQLGQGLPRSGPARAAAHGA